MNTVIIIGIVIIAAILTYAIFKPKKEAKPPFNGSGGNSQGSEDYEGEGDV